MTTFLLNMTCNHLYKSSYQNCLSSSTRRYGQTWSLDWLGTTFVSRVKNDASVEQRCVYMPRVFNFKTHREFSIEELFDCDECFNEQAAHSALVIDESLQWTSAIG